MDDYEHCFECSGYGNDYYTDENGNLVCYCPECLLNPNRKDEDYE